MKNRIRKICACILCAGLCFSTMAGCNIMEKSKPMLKIITSDQLGMTIFTTTKYYIVYDNGTVNKTSEFIPSDVEGYAFFPKEYMKDSIALHNIDINTPQGEKINQIANNILFLTNETKFQDVSMLYVLGERYFFNVICDKDSKLLEYSATNNTITEIVSFRSGSIIHVELYEPESDGGE